MSKPTLYIRSTRPRSGLDQAHYGFTKVPAFYDNYQLAVLDGQARAGHGNFYVYTGDVVPSREDQLLLEPRKRVRSHPKLDAAMLED